MDKISICEGLKLKRKELNLSVREVVEMLASENVEVAEKTIYGWESGHRQPDADTFILLCKIYKVTDFSYFSSVETNLIEQESLSNEEALLKSYRNLNEDGKAKASSYIEDLTEMEKYKKNHKFFKSQRAS